MKIKNENGRAKVVSVKILHWNLGARHWHNKTESIQAMVDFHIPDLAYISEANMYTATPAHETRIEGYSIIKTKNAEKAGISRLVLLVREGVEIRLEDNLMEENVASIWIRCPRKGGRKLLVGGIYREHKLLCQTGTNTTGNLQVERWENFYMSVGKS